MKKLLLLCLAASLLHLNIASAADAQDAKDAKPKAEGKSEAVAAMDKLFEKVQAKLAQNKRTEKELEPELKEFDDLVERFKGGKADEVAHILYMKATLYVQVLEDTPKAIALLEKIKKDFPTSSQAKAVDPMIADFRDFEAGKQINRQLTVGSKFPEFDEKDHTGKPLTLASFKGKVVLVDFWATWCGPCVRELPNVLETYNKYHAQGFEIVGISLDEEKDDLTKFLEKNKMPWQQYFDGQGWKNKLAKKYGISSIPATYLLDKEGKILAKELHGESLGQAVAKAVGKAN